MSKVNPNIDKSLTIYDDNISIKKSRTIGHSVYALAKNTDKDNISNDNHLIVHTDNPNKHIAKYTAYALGNLYNEVVDNTSRAVDVKRYQSELYDKNQSIEILKMEIESLRNGSKSINEDVKIEDKIKGKKIEKQMNKYKARLDKINIQIACYESKKNDMINIIKSLEMGSLDDCSDVE